MYNYNQEIGRVLSVQPNEIGQRLDRYLTSVINDLSRSTAQQLIADGAVLVNEKPGKAGYMLRANDQIHLLQLAPTPPVLAMEPNDIPFDVVYEDEDIVVVNKPAGLVVHPSLGHVNDTLVNALLARYPELGEIGGEMRPGIVHRLDRDTSGLIIIARNAQTLTALTEQMQQHKIIKRYLALVNGVVSLDQGSIDAPIGRDPRHRQQMAITTQESREARTHFRVLERFARYTLLLVQLETGRTHQIRVHLQAIGHTVVGDPVYGSSAPQRGFTLHRQFLHAFQLHFTHPTTGATLELEAPLPEDLQAVLDRKTVL